MSLTLMTLPAEIRCMIWKFALTETISPCGSPLPDTCPLFKCNSQPFPQFQNPRLRLLLISKSAHREINALSSAFTFRFFHRMHLNYVLGRMVEYCNSQEQLGKLLRDLKTLQFSTFVEHSASHRIHTEPLKTVEGVMMPNGYSSWGERWYLDDLEKEARVISQRSNNDLFVAMRIEVTLKGWKSGSMGNPIAL